MGAEPNDPNFSILLAPNHRDLPPAILQVAGGDPLRDGGLLYDQLLRESGVKTKLHVYVAICRMSSHSCWLTPLIPAGILACLTEASTCSPAPGYIRSGNLIIQEDWDGCFQVQLSTPTSVTQFTQHSVDDPSVSSSF